jgi:hypothetical protein
METQKTDQPALDTTALLPDSSVFSLTLQERDKRLDTFNSIEDAIKFVEEISKLLTGLGDEITFPNAPTISREWCFTGVECVSLD